MPEHNLVISNACIIDGTGKPRYRADLAISEGRISHIGACDPASAEHHLDAGELQDLLGDIEAFDPKITALVDIERGLLPYGLFWLLATLFFHRSFIRHDGLASIRRSYTAAELEAVAPAGWVVERLRPFGLVLVRYQAMP